MNTSNFLNHLFFVKFDFKNEKNELSILVMLRISKT